MEYKLKWKVVRVYHGLLDTRKEIIRTGISEKQAKEMAARLDSNPGSSATVYIAEPDDMGEDNS